MEPTGPFKKVWYSTGPQPKEFRGTHRRIRRRAEIPDWNPDSASPVFYANKDEEEPVEQREIIPVMPYINVDGKRTLMEISIKLPPQEKREDQSTAQEKEESANAQEESKEEEPEVKAWNSSIVAESFGDAQGQSLYRTIHTHNLQEESSCTPRGLFNTNNMCFYNSVLQVLVNCGRFNALFKDIIQHTPLLEISNFSENPEEKILSAIAHFFYLYSNVGNVKRAMSSDELYTVICNEPKYFNVERGRQEDAQEFLTNILDLVEKAFKDTKPTTADTEDNLIDLKRAASNLHDPVDPDASTDDAGEWVEVGHNSKAVETQHSGHQDLDNPVVELFGGKFRSILVKSGGKPSITTEPFQQIPVDISDESVNTVQHALDEMFKVESLTLDGSSATKRLEIQRLPPILIVNLKRFTFRQIGDSFDFGKITKPVIIDEKITLPLMDNRTVDYAPFAVIYHHGMDIYRGHYTADVKVKDQWFSTDDEQVFPIESDRVVGHGTNKGSQSAYMVFYTRLPSSN